MTTRTPEFRLISCTENPVETLFACWAQSRPTQYPDLFNWLRSTCKRDVISAIDIKEAIIQKVIDPASMEEVFKKVIAMSIPVSEALHFTWGLANLPIEWREQAVRKRQWGFWLTSMREFSMDDFVRDGRWAPAVEGAISADAEKFLEDFMRRIEDGYNELLGMGVPQEIARKVIPLCATHNGTMFSNFRTLLDTVESRSCWIAQADLWAPVMVGMVRDLRERHPLLGAIVSPPCFDRYSDQYKGCAYKLINENRLTKDPATGKMKDPYAPCPLYVMHEPGEHNAITPHPVEQAVQGVPAEVVWTRIMEAAGVQSSYIQQGQRLLPIWQSVWNRDPFSGKLL